MAQLKESRHNRAMKNKNSATRIEKAVFETLAASTAGITLAELLTLHPSLARRTAQRWISQWISQGQVVAQGNARARRYLANIGNNDRSRTSRTESAKPAWVHVLPLSPDSRDILAYVEQPLLARKPIGYQHAFLQSYL